LKSHTVYPLLQSNPRNQIDQGVDVTVGAGVMLDVGVMLGVGVFVRVRVAVDACISVGVFVSMAIVLGGVGVLIGTTDGSMVGVSRVNVGAVVCTLVHAKTNIKKAIVKTKLKGHFIKILPYYRIPQCAQRSG
jgi:hypothetical protein